MRHDDAAWHHPRIEEVEARPGAGFQVDIEMHEREQLVRHRPRRAGKAAGMEHHLRRLGQKRPHRRQPRAILPRPQMPALRRLRLRQPVEGVEQMQPPPAARQRDQLGRAPLIDAHLRHHPRQRALRPRQRVQHERLVAGEQALALAPHLPDQPQHVALLVPAQRCQLHPGEDPHRHPPQGRHPRIHAVNVTMLHPHSGRPSIPANLPHTARPSKERPAHPRPDRRSLPPPDAKQHHDAAAQHACFTSRALLS